MKLKGLVILATALSVVALGGCKTDKHVSLTPLPNSANGFTKLSASDADSALRAALTELLLHQIKNSLPSDNDQYKFEFIFVSFGADDPPKSFVDQFTNCAYTVKPVSASFSNHDGFFDIQSKRRGILCNYEAFKWNGPMRIEFDSKIVVAGLSGAGMFYEMGLVGNKWQVNKHWLKWER